MTFSDTHRVEAHPRSIVLLRVLILACVVPLLVYLCFQTGHARLKGTPMEAWRLIPLIITAVIFALLGKRFLNSISGLFLGGIGGVVGTLDTMAGPYGGIVGLLVGAVVIANPFMLISEVNSLPHRTESRQDGNDVEHET